VNRIVLILMMLASPVAAEVRIVVEPAQSATRTFDPAHRPAEMPALHPSEAAVAQANFSCAVDLDYTVVERQAENGKATIALKIADVHMTLRLQTTVWLPTKAPDDLVRHERGHEAIGKRLLEQGKAVAEPIAKALEGRVVSGSGASLDDAEQAATRSVVNAICAAYLNAMEQRANRVNAQFDRITDHGRLKGSVDDAVNRALSNADTSATRAAMR
jgi:hypothetical protein